ncbi:hypothetical protein NDU88_010995 [Pleurodeles waltl]|uniref:Putative nuclease HARBI1 n=1 Tax=Pleurodeles waltl TaxID=8319 RepID=A0AAV7QXC4_PLEWA|nr:hypothetical protein NDU88_010995 [Pleurodeles waltl]
MHADTEHRTNNRSFYNTSRDPKGNAEGRRGYSTPGQPFWDSANKTSSRLNWQAIQQLLRNIEQQLAPSLQTPCTIPPETKLLAVLHMWASGSFQTTGALVAGISQPSFSAFLPKVLDAIISLTPRHISFPNTQQKQQETKQGFYQINGFPHVLGAFDCTHVRLVPPAATEHLYRNRKHTHSINVQAIVHHRGLITNIVRKYPGSVHDSFIFRHCTINQHFQDGRYGNGLLIAANMNPIQIREFQGRAMRYRHILDVELGFRNMARHYRHERDSGVWREFAQGGPSVSTTATSSTTTTQVAGGGQTVEEDTGDMCMDVVEVYASEVCSLLGVVMMQVVDDDVEHAGVNVDVTGWEVEEEKEGETVEIVDIFVYATGWCLCDSAYALRQWILTPYLTPGNQNERRYNIAHRRTRAVIERTFGLLKSQFRCLHKSGGALQYAPETACKIVATCAILHNIATRRGLYLTPDDTDSEDEEQELSHRQPGDRSIAMEGRRNHIATHYFGRYVETVTTLTNVRHTLPSCVVQQINRFIAGL